jgi:hypothetical protein
VILIGYSPLFQPHKNLTGLDRDFTETIRVVLNAQSTDQVNGCQATHDREAKNVVVFKLKCCFTAAYWKRWTIWNFQALNLKGSHFTLRVNFPITLYRSSDICGSYSGNYVNCCHLGCGVMNSGRNSSAFVRKSLLVSPEWNPKRTLSYYSVVRMEISCPSEESINFYLTTRDHIPEDTNLHVSSCVRG